MFYLKEVSAQSLLGCHNCGGQVLNSDCSCGWRVCLPLRSQSGGKREEGEVGRRRKKRGRRSWGGGVASMTRSALCLRSKWVLISSQLVVSAEHSCCSGCRLSLSVLQPSLGIRLSLVPPSSHNRIKRETEV